MKIAIGSDHAGYQLKSQIIELLEELGHDVVDRGTDSIQSCDYPDFAIAVAHDVSTQAADFGILVCSTGIGMSMTANKVKDVRAALVHTVYEAELTRQHNNANVLCLGANLVGAGIAKAAVTTFLNAKFEGGRHERRVKKIGAALHVKNG